MVDFEKGEEETIARLDGVLQVKHRQHGLHVPGQHIDKVAELPVLLVLSIVPDGKSAMSAGGTQNKEDFFVVAHEQRLRRHVLGIVQQEDGVLVVDVPKRQMNRTVLLEVVNRFHGE